MLNTLIFLTSGACLAALGTFALVWMNRETGEDMESRFEEGDDIWLSGMARSCNDRDDPLGIFASGKSGPVRSPHDA